MSTCMVCREREAEGDRLLCPECYADGQREDPRELEALSGLGWHYDRDGAAEE